MRIGLGFKEEKRKRRGLRFKGKKKKRREELRKREEMRFSFQGREEKRT
jgi:hypothetical protein